MAYHDWSLLVLLLLLLLLLLYNCWPTNFPCLTYCLISPILGLKHWNDSRSSLCLYNHILSRSSLCNAVSALCLYCFFLTSGKDECLLCANRKDVSAEKNINCWRLTSEVCLERYGCGSGCWVLWCVCVFLLCYSELWQLLAWYVVISVAEEETVLPAVYICPKHWYLPTQTITFWIFKMLKLEIF